MTLRQRKTVVYAVIPFLAAVGVFWDFITPLGVADWVWYFIPLLLSVYAGGRSLPFILAAVFSVLTLAGFYLSPPGIDPELAFVSRVIGVCVQWLMAYTIWRRKKTEEKNLQLAAIVESSDDAIIGKTLDGVITSWNRGAEKIYGYGEGEVVGKSIALLIPPGLENEMPRLIERIRRGEQVDRYETVRRRKDGSLIDVALTVSPVKNIDAEVVAASVVARDITQSKQAEETLRKSEQQYRELIELANSIIVRWKPDGEITFLNEFGQKFFGYAAGQIVGRQVVGTIVPETESTGRNLHPLMDQIRADPKAFEQNVNENVRRNGERVWIAWTNKAILDEQGQVREVLSIGTDITERKQAEAALRESMALYHSLVEQLPAGVFRKDAEGRYEFVNSWFCRLKGVKAELFLGKKPAEVAAIELLAGAANPSNVKQLATQGTDHHQQIMQTGRPIEVEEHGVDADGKEQHLSVLKTPIFGSDGKIVGTQGILFDITERKRAEEALRESTALYHSLVEQMPSGIFREDRAGRYVFVNSWFCRLRGLPADQMVGRTPDELVAVEAAGRGGANPEIVQMLHDGSRHHEEILRTGKPIHVEEVYPTADGGKRYLRVVKSAVFGPDGRIVGTQGIQFDVTDLKQAEAHIREQAALLGKAQDASMVVDPDERIVFWNRSAERIYGWTKAEAIGKTPLELFQGGAVSPRHGEALRIVKERGEWSGELQEVTRDGRAVTVQGRCNLIYNELGQPKARLIINTDVTERKKLEAQFLRAQRMESLGTLAGGIAHDLNNVLTPLLVSVQVLKEKAMDEDGKRLLQSLEANVQRGAGLVKQVLGFGRGMEGERIVVQPKHIAREIRQMIVETFPKSVAFELYSAPDLWSITGDPTQLHQILLNLCLNARDAMPKGGKLSLRLENVVLDEAYARMNLEARPGPHVCLAVTDTGTGIPKEIQEKIFDPFFTTKEPGKGTGLGLSTTLAIVKSHGGFIHCYSEPGRGSTFKVFLPANPVRADAEKVVAKNGGLPQGHNNLVLVVDDEEPIRKLAQRALERYGYRVLLAADGTEAVSLYQPRRNEIDVVITDMAMPNMDGLATISALKALNPDVKIIGSSGLASDGSVAKAMAAGIQHFIPKPYTAETILHTLHEILNGNGKH